MDIANRIMVVTGGASGIGKALAEAFHREGARHVVVADLDDAGAKEVAEAIGGTGVGLDVADEGAVRDLVAATQANIGPIDLFMSNAGFVTMGGLEVPNKEINDQWEVHVMSHVYAARAVLPSMIERGEGYIMSTASAAGLLTQIGSLDGVLTAEQAADACIDAVRQERFWVLPHPEVAEYVRRKATDVDRWLHGMRRFQGRLYEGQPLPGDWFVDAQGD